MLNSQVYTKHSDEYNILVQEGPDLHFAKQYRYKERVGQAF